MKKTSFVQILLACLVLIASMAILPARAEIVTLSVWIQNPTNSIAVATNQIVQVTSFGGSSPEVWLSHSSGVTASGTVGGKYTGITNISIYAASSPNNPNAKFPGLVTFTIASSTDSSIIPANCVVIPSDATGPVQILLESSADLVSWTGALPGTYGASSTNRFFRVRAVATP